MTLEFQRILQSMLYLLEQLAVEERVARDSGIRLEYNRAVSKTLKHRNNIMSFCRKNWRKEDDEK